MWLGLLENLERVLDCSLLVGEVKHRSLLGFDDFAFHLLQQFSGLRRIHFERIELSWCSKFEFYNVR